MNPFIRQNLNQLFCEERRGRLVMVYKGKVIFKTTDHKELRDAFQDKIKEVKRG